MISPPFENGGFNSSFLVLNLGNNTLGFGNSSIIPMPSEAVHANLIEKPHSQNVVETSNPGSSSTDDTSSQSRRKTSKRPSNDRNDPDWIPERKAKRSNGISSRVTKPKFEAVVNDEPSEASAEGDIGFLNSAPGTPPPYLEKLLNYFGWKIVFQPGSNDYVYISPYGVSYYSPTKAYESFLLSSSKYKEKPWVTLPFDDNVEVRSLSSLSPKGKLGKSQGLVIGPKSDRKQEVERCTGMNSTVDENSKTPRTKHQDNVATGENNITMLSRKSSVKASEGLNQLLPPAGVNENSPNTHKCSGGRSKQASCVNILSAASDQSCDDKSLIYGKFSEAGWSTQLCKRHIPVESNSEIKGTHNSSFLEKNRETDENMMKASSHSELEILKMPEDVSIKESLIGTKSSCAHVSAAEDNPEHRISMERDVKKVRSRRSKRSTGKDVLMGDDMAMVFGENNSVSHKSFINMPDIYASRKLCSPENSFSLSKYSTPRCKDFGPIEQKWDKSSMIPLNSQGNGHISSSRDVPGTRRSMRINGKHVYVDNDSDVEIEADNEAFRMCSFSTEIVFKEKNMLGGSFSRFQCKDGQNTTQDHTQLKDASTKEYRSVKQMADSNSKKHGNEKKPGSGKSTELKAPAVEGHLLSFDGKRRQKADRYLREKDKKQSNRRLVVRRKGEDNGKDVSSTRRLTLLSWLLDSGVMNENDKVLYISQGDMGDIPCGIVTQDGIWCQCCKQLMPLLRFGAHADKKRCMSWDNIFLISGKTLSQCLEETWKREKERNKVGYLPIRIDGPDPSDDTCGICGDGGRLICCDGCPSTFHQECLRLKTGVLCCIMYKVLSFSFTCKNDHPDGTWYCPYCRCAFCMMTEPDRDGTMLACKQCCRKYHQNCAAETITHEDPVTPLFCGENCKKLAARLSEICGVRNPIKEGFSWTLLKYMDDESSISVDQISGDLECKVKLSMALYVLNECFIPLMDKRTGVDMLCQAVYNQGSNFNRLNYEGFYTLILEKEEEIVSVASIRFLGTKLAEMPFVGTRPSYQKQGMCRRLINAIEDLLSSLCIENLVIPAIPDLLETWMTSFSFRPLESSLKDEIKNLSMVIFPDTILLQKTISNSKLVASEDAAAANVHSSKEISNNHNLHIDTSKGLWDRECGDGQKDVTTNPQRMIDANCSFTPDYIVASSLGFLGVTSVQGLPKLNTTELHQEDMVLQSLFPPTSAIIQHADPLGVESIMQNNQTNMSSHSGYELNDMQKYAIACTLSFDKLFRSVG